MEFFEDCDIVVKSPFLRDQGLPGKWKRIVENFDIGPEGRHHDVKEREDGDNSDEGQDDIQKYSL